MICFPFSPRCVILLKHSFKKKGARRKDASRRYLMGTYLVPCAAPVSDNWQAHKNRVPPSVEPGTDYACAVGTPIKAASDGTIYAVQNSISSAAGRVVTLKTVDGNYIRYLHLKSIPVTVGQVVSRGQTIAISGASANGSESGVGAHVHVTLRVGSPTGSTVDFEKYIGDVEDVVPSYKSVASSRSSPQALPNGNWVWAYINDANDISFLTGKHLVSGVIFLEFSGLTVGQDLHVRWVISNISGTTTTNKYGRIVEVIGTGGKTYAEVSDISDLGASSRLRVEVRALSAGVTLNVYQVKLLYW